MEELKAGADFDELSAKEAALLAIKDAEDVILRRYYDPTSGKKGCLNHDNTKNTANTACETRTVRKDGEYATQFWREKTNWENRKTSGIYDGDDPDDRCNDETCLGNKTVRDAWYEATKDEDCKDTGGSVICYGQYTGRTALDKQRAKYIIEVFRPDGSVFEQTLRADPDGDNTIVLRVTAVGYSQDVANKGNFRSGAVPNNTYAMYQATYILSSE